MFERFTGPAAPGSPGRWPGPRRPSAAIRSARSTCCTPWRHTYLGDEHLLLGLLAAAQLSPRGDFTLGTLRDLGIDPVQARQRVLDELRHAPGVT